LEAALSVNTSGAGMATGASAARADMANLSAEDPIIGWKKKGRSRAAAFLSGRAPISAC
jgi:hypothetical protein